MLEQDFKLKVFITVTQTRSFTEAARLLGVSQSAVSQNVSELERQLGAQLFIRSRQEILLTEKGKIFHAFTRKILNTYDDINSVFSEFEAFQPFVDTLLK